VINFYPALTGTLEVTAAIEGEITFTAALDGTVDLRRCH